MKPGKLFQILIIGLIIYAVYWYWKKGTFSGFGFGAANTAIMADGSVPAEKPSDYASANFNNIMSAQNPTAQNPQLTSGKKIVYSWPTLKVPVDNTVQPGLTDVIQWPPGVTISPSNLNVFNWFMNQDAIICYMSDIDLDICYEKYYNMEIATPVYSSVTAWGSNTNYNPKTKANVYAPIGWDGPYISCPYYTALVGIAPPSGRANRSELKSGNGGNAATTQNGVLATGQNYTVEQIQRTNNIVTIIGNYTKLYEYITGVPGTETELGYGLANIQVGIENSALPNPLLTFTDSGSFNDGAFYSTYTGTSGAPTSENRSFTTFTLNGETKHAIWSVLLARQSQLIGRLNSTIISEY
jgi:hypothetical protein